MKKLLFTLTLIVSLLSGCVTAPDGTSQPNIPRIAAVAKEAAALGTIEVLAQRPDWKPHFEIAYKQLVALEAKDAVTAADLLDIVSGLPVKELKSDEARITITATRILIAGTDWSVIDAERLQQIRPIITAIREGLEDGGVKPES